MTKVMDMHFRKSILLKLKCSDYFINTINLYHFEIKLRKFCVYHEQFTRCEISAHKITTGPRAARYKKETYAPLGRMRRGPIVISYQRDFMSF